MAAMSWPQAPTNERRRDVGIESSIWGTRPTTGDPAGPGVCLGSRTCRSLVARLLGIGAADGGRPSRPSACRRGVADSVAVSPSAAHLPAPPIARGHSAPSRRAGQRSPGQPPPGHRSTTGRRSPTTGRSPRGRQELGTPLALNRSYFTPTTTRRHQLVRRCRDDLARGRLPHVSIKPRGTWRDDRGGRGATTGWPSCSARWATKAGPIFLTLHHEPENDAGRRRHGCPSDYVAMQRRAIEPGGRPGAAGHHRPRPAALDLRPGPRRHRPGRPGSCRRRP